jgi:hypothetical protein
VCVAKVPDFIRIHARGREGGSVGGGGGSGESGKGVVSAEESEKGLGCGGSILKEGVVKTC